MWLVSNRTPCAADRSWLQDKDANKIWLVVVKATFDIRPDGSTRLADHQLPVLRSARHHGEPGESSLAAEADLLWTKPCTDVLVDGTAWAPGGRAVESFDVGMRIGEVHKVLRVFGDRLWQRGVVGPTISRPRPLDRLPIRYERAFGQWANCR